MSTLLPYGWTASATFVVVVGTAAIAVGLVTLWRDRPWKRAVRDAELRRITDKYRRMA